MDLFEILKANGVEAEALESIAAAMKEHKIFTASQENLDARYSQLQADHEGVSKQLEEANALIEELKKSTKDQEDLQQRIVAYEGEVKSLQTELEQTKINGALKVALLSGKAQDVDYLTFKLQEKLKRDGEALKLDDNGAIKGWSERLNWLKAQFPNMFTQPEEEKGNLQVLEPNKLKAGSEVEEPAPTAEAFRAMTYEQRVALKQKNEQLYRQLARKGMM